MVKRILVALSGTPYTPSAVRHALRLADQHGAAVTGVTIIDTTRLGDVGPVPLGGGSAAHHLAEHRLHLTEERVEHEIADFERACSESGKIHCVVRERGDAMDQLIHLSRYHDLTVIGLRGLFEYGVVHNPTDVVVKLVARGVRPILAVALEYRPIRRVLIAYNGSRAAASAMRRFVQAATDTSVDVKIVCFDLDESAAGDLLADARAYCAAHGFRARTEHRPAGPREHLLADARAWSADLIVLGATARSRIAQLILGDTALRAIRESEIPLLLSQ